jgi:hypothetical protein
MGSLGLPACLPMKQERSNWVLPVASCPGLIALRTRAAGTDVDKAADAAPTYQGRNIAQINLHAVA